MKRSWRIQGDFEEKEKEEKEREKEKEKEEEEIRSRFPTTCRR